MPSHLGINHNAMARRYLLRIATAYAKEYGAAIIAAALLYGGIHQVISASSQPIAIGIIQLISGIARKAFRDITLSEYVGIPWVFYARVFAIGVIVIVAGLFVGLWANLRSERQSSATTLEEIQN